MRRLCRIIITARSGAMLLILCGLILCSARLARTQPVVADSIPGPDWRSALILRFDPPTHGSAREPVGDYWSAVAHALESGWVTSTGADAISVAASDSNEEWDSLVAAARRAGVPIIIPDAKSPGQDHHPVRIAGASENPSFDAFLEELPRKGMDDINALKALYKSLSERVAGAAHPIITSIPIPPGSTPLAARVLLLPGAVQFAAVPSGADNGVLWRVVAAFRQRHPSVATGEHEDLANNTYSFARTSSDRNVDDAVIVAFEGSGTTTINVSRVFADNTLLQDAVTGRTAFVSFGMATFEADASGVMLIEEAL